jgi:LmbE family N-acetylglucosaminyl deacetylase
MVKYILLTISLLSSQIAFSQQLRPDPSPEMYHQIQSLKNLPRVLYLAAHPDDENTALLSWLVNQEHIHTAYLSLTRGDGGQNLIGSEQGASLGLIRTYELLEARKLDGARQYFSRAVDFGFSKNTDDTFRQWDADSITADVVKVIREFRPDVIITRFPPTAAAGHGQHAASAVIAEKAFRAVSQEEWAPRRLLWNTFRFGNVNTTRDDQFKVTAGQYDPLRGMGYGELAGISRSRHQSQGAGTPSRAGLSLEYFEHVMGQPARESLFDGIPMNWTEAGQAQIDKAIDQLLQRFDFIDPGKSLPEMVQLRRLISSTNDPLIRQEKLSTLDRIILSAAGFMGEVISSREEALAGETIDFHINLISRSPLPVEVLGITAFGSGIGKPHSLEYDVVSSTSAGIRIPESTGVTEPYWLKEPQNNPYQYTVTADSLIGLPEAKNPLFVSVQLQIAGQQIPVRLPLSFKKLDPIKGDVVEPIRIVPPVNIRFQQDLYVRKSGAPLRVGVRLETRKAVDRAELYILNKGTPVASVKNIQLPAGADSTFQVDLGQMELSEMEAVLRVDDQEFKRFQSLIRYPHIPTLSYYSPARAPVIGSDIQVTAKKIGYITGAGDFIPGFLKIAGLEVVVLQESDLVSANRLAGYDAIVTGIRTINAEKRMREWMPVLHHYVKNGGTLLMQFNTLQDMATTTIGPYPFSIGRDRVTEEDARVRILDPKHPLLNYPNRIGESDFGGWTQEKGLYFVRDWDERYTPLFEMNDTGEQALQGSTLYAPYGKGHFIYTSLSFFRQLPIGHEGAARLFFNMLSAGSAGKEKSGR